LVTKMPTNKVCDFFYKLTFTRAAKLLKSEATSVRKKFKVG